VAPFKAVAPPRPKRSKLDYKPQRIKTPRKSTAFVDSKGSEHWHQATFTSILRTINHPAAKWSHASANGYLRTKSMRLRAWKEGNLKGVLDYFTPWPAQGFHGMFLEFKKSPNKPTPEQLAFIDAMRALGYKAEIVWNWQEALEVWCSYVGIRVDVAV
jgi:hypothetical protein